MAEKQPRRKPKPDRARQRAIRAQAAATGVPYTVAARQIDGPLTREELAAFARGFDPQDWANSEMLASRGRTIYPASSDTHRHGLIASRQRRPATDRVRDARLAADLPAGRARHLAERFPPTRGEPGTGVGLLYHGAGREEALSLLYCLVAHERPDLVPSAGDLAWEAELGEETAIDTACTELDRAARLLLDSDPVELRLRIEAALMPDAADRSGPVSPARQVALRERACGWSRGTEATRLTAWYRTAPALPFDGVRHMLDAVLVVGEDGHAPGTRVRMLRKPHRRRQATIVGAIWDQAGPPIGYDVWPDGAGEAYLAHPPELMVLPTPD